MGKSRPKKSGTTRKRRAPHKPRKHEEAVDAARSGMSRYEPIEEVDGVMSGMIGGFRRAVGVQRPEKKTWVDGALLWALFLIIAAAVAYRFLG